MVLLASSYDQVAVLQGRRSRRREEIPDQGRDRGDRLVETRRSRSWSSGSPTTSAACVLNKTNNRTLRGAFGDDVQRLDRTRSRRCSRPWLSSAARWCPCLRVRIPPPKQATAGNGQATAPSAKPKPTTVAQTLDETEARSRRRSRAVKPSLADDLDDEIPF